MATGTIPAQPLIVNPNLLINSYFVGGGSQRTDRKGAFPINSRGQTSYIGAVYGVDRWYGDNANTTVTLHDDYITVATTDGNHVPTFAQHVGIPYENMKNKTVTFSALFRGNARLRMSIGTPSGSAHGSSYFTSADWTVISFTYTFGEESAPRDHFGAWLQAEAGNSFDLKAVKAELGGTQTLARLENGVWVLNEIPKWEDELLRCQTDAGDAADDHANRTVELTENTIVLDYGPITLSEIASWSGGYYYQVPFTIPSGYEVISATLTQFSLSAGIIITTATGSAKTAVYIITNTTTFSSNAKVSVRAVLRKT